MSLCVLIKDMQNKSLIFISYHRSIALRKFLSKFLNPVVTYYREKVARILFCQLFPK